MRNYALFPLLVREGGVLAIADNEVVRIEASEIPGMSIHK
jgi:hypothetical protein